MSLEDLKNALTAGKPPRAVVVSTQLFAQLYEAAELRPAKQQWNPPTDPACKKVLDTWLRVEGLPVSDQLVTVTWRLVSHEEVRVVRDTDVFLTLRERGPKSFEFIYGR